MRVFDLGDMPQAIADVISYIDASCNEVAEQGGCEICPLYGKCEAISQIVEVADEEWEEFDKLSGKCATGIWEGEDDD